MPTKEAKEGGLVCHNIATDTTHHSSVVLCPLHSPAVSRVGSETVQCSPAEHQTLARC